MTASDVSTKTWVSIIVAILGIAGAGGYGYRATAGDPAHERAIQEHDRRLIALEKHDSQTLTDISSIQTDMRNMKEDISETKEDTSEIKELLIGIQMTVEKAH